MVLSLEREAHADDDPCDDWSNYVHTLPRYQATRNDDDRQDNARSDRRQPKHDSSVVSYDILRLLRGG